MAMTEPLFAWFAAASVAVVALDHIMFARPLSGLLLLSRP